MEITRQRIRIDYAPLSAAVSLSCLTSGSPLTQVFNARANAYEPNRELTPTVLLPTVVVNATDGSLSSPYGNTMLANMVWKVNGVDITTLPEWQGQYTIHTNGSMRGAITISKNTEVGKQYELSFSAVVADMRTGVNIPIQTDSVILSTTDKSESGFSLAITEDTIIRYNPFRDKLHAYDYKVAHGIIPADDSVYSACFDGNQYKRTIPITLFQGAETFAGQYTVRLFRMNADKTETEVLATDTNEASEIAPNFITLDLRVIIKGDYVIRAYVDGKDVAQIQFSVGRIYPAYTVRASNGTAIAPTDKHRYDVAMVDCDGQIVEHAENLIIMVWYTSTAYKSDVRHNEGGDTLYTLESTGIGKNYDDGWLEQYIETRHKDAFSFATDESGNVLTDENGNQLIFN